MEECKIEKKRSREDSDPESKRVRIDVEEVVFNSPEADAGLGMYSPEAKQIREDILDILDEQETFTDRLPEVMKSFEEEIVHPSAQQNILDLMSSDSIDPQPDLGYLQEASDNELGLPPTLSSFDDHVDAKINLLESENAIEFENELLPSHDSFELGLFDYQESLEFSQFCQSMPA
ncbi:uncharacterized protein LOC129888454 [Solanum dulcamara]|uniref:uncharacterized protein LOC129888454 n=1 Tax=Solanum dulcamara TaxID=45834 RepID=UPI0024862AB1|nr:uncharacterized protein LOC129888454 [Solanum dulcamara]